MTRCILRLIGIASLMAIAVGCGAGKVERVAITGSVSFDGKPIEDGQIAFVPQGGGFNGVGAIKNGKYDISSDRGPSPGPCTIRITGNRPTGRKTKPSAYSGDQTPQEVYEQFLPAKFNESSELTLEIPNESTFAHDFELKSS